jgi:hypothetical protein
MAMAEYNITIEAHSDYSRSFQIKVDGTPLDLSGYSFAAQIREHHTSPDSVDFTVNIVDAPTGVIAMSLTDEVTGTLEPGTQYYDLVMTGSDSRKQRLLGGRAFVKAGITR